MSKNGSRIISFGRYRITDLLLFAIILVAFEVIVFFAYTEWFDTDPTRFVVSLVAPISLMAMVRWNWYGMFYGVLGGLIYSLLLIFLTDIAGTVYSYILTYCIGNTFVGLAYLMVRFMGYKRITGKWYFTMLYAVCGWVCIVLGRATVSAFFGNNFFSQLLHFASADIISLALCIIVLQVMRKLDGMMERQKDYLLRLDKERKEKMLIDNFGEAPSEIDEETLKALNKKGDDLFK